MELGRDLLQEAINDMDQMLIDSGKRKMNWNIDKHDHKQLITSIGTIHYNKTLFSPKENKGKEGAYLINQILGIEQHERLSEDAAAKLYQEAVQTSYGRAGGSVNWEDMVSKETVKNKIHSLKFPSETEKPEKKKVVKNLYIEADEDHVPLQFHEKKGDLKRNKNHRKDNCAIVKLIYVHEGVVPEAPGSKRNHLIQVHYFSGIYDGAENSRLWNEVYAYLDSHYDLDRVKHIYLNGDGGAWISAGKKQIAGTSYVLDEFHISEYLLKMTGHMLDSAQDARDELCEAIRKGTKTDFQSVVERIDNCANSEAAHKRIAESAGYILRNWMPAKVRLMHKDGVKGCSAEGHVSHILSDRMSSRPMGWSREGADKIAHLRAYEANQGDMLDLVRMQKEELPKAAGAENEILSSAEMLAWEHQNEKPMGKAVEAINHSLPSKYSMLADFNPNIWGL